MTEITPEITVQKIDKESYLILSVVLISASDDPALDNNSVPRLNSEEQVLKWLEDQGWLMWVIRKGTLLVGYIGIHEPELFEESERYQDYLELDYYILPPYRGNRIISYAWADLKKQLPQGAKFVAEIWEDNKPSITVCEREGWEYAGRFYWASENYPESEGYCHRYTFII